MKKLYFILFIAFAGMFNTAEAQAPQCTYDYAWLALGRNGVWPDSATNFVSGTVGQPYLQNVTVKVPQDTTVSGFTFTFSHIDLQTNISSPVNYGLPPGLSLAGTPSNFQFPGNDTSCMVIYGTPTTAGTYNLSFTLKTYMQGVPSAFNTQTITYYKIVINSAAGIQENTALKFDVANPLPNPAKNNTTIRYILSKSSDGKISVYNTLGKAIITKKLEGKPGDNSIDLNVSEMASGIYFYSIEFEGKAVTKRLIVNND